MARNFLEASLGKCGGCACENKRRGFFFFCDHGIAFYNFTALTFDIIHCGF